MLSNKAKYGLKAMMYLAQYGEDRPVQIGEIAEKRGISRKFLDAILLELKNAGFLISRKGKNGGYHLAMPPHSIILGNVLRVLDGPLAPIPCASRLYYRPCADCEDEASCAIRAVMLNVRDAIATVLDKTTLADMIGQGDKAFETILRYDI